MVYYLNRLKLSVFRENRIVRASESVLNHESRVYLRRRASNCVLIWKEILRADQKMCTPYCENNIKLSFERVPENVSLRW